MRMSFEDVAYIVFVGIVKYMADKVSNCIVVGYPPYQSW